jgi:hypothetical protein
MMMLNLLFRKYKFILALTKVYEQRFKCFLGGLGEAVREKLFTYCGEFLQAPKIATTTKPSSFGRSV